MIPRYSAASPESSHRSHSASGALAAVTRGPAFALEDAERFLHVGRREDGVAGLSEVPLEDRHEPLVFPAGGLGLDDVIVQKVFPGSRRNRKQIGPWRVDQDRP